MFNIFVVWLGAALPLILTSLKMSHAVLASLTFASVLTWPGYIVTLWLWPKPGQLELSQRLALVPMFSILVIVVVSLFAWAGLRNAAPVVIHAITFGSLTLITLLTRTLRAGSRREVAFVSGMFAVIGGLAILTMAAPSQGLSSFLFPMSQSRREPLPGAFTEFYVVESPGVEGKPVREGVAGQASRITIGVANHEGLDMHYTVTVIAGDKVIGVSPIFLLADGAVWEQPIAFTLPTPGDNQAVVFLLEGTGYASPYHTLQLRVNAEAPPRTP